MFQIYAGSTVNTTLKSMNAMEKEFYEKPIKYYKKHMAIGSTPVFLLKAIRGVLGCLGEKRL